MDDGRLNTVGSWQYVWSLLMNLGGVQPAVGCFLRLCGVLFSARYQLGDCARAYTAAGDSCFDEARVLWGGSMYLIGSPQNIKRSCWVEIPVGIAPLDNCDCVGSMVGNHVLAHP